MIQKGTISSNISKQSQYLPLSGVKNSINRIKCSYIFMSLMPVPYGANYNISD